MADPSTEEALQRRETFSGNPVLPMATAMAMGTVFGFALTKGRVVEPLVVADQMAFRRFIMMKMFFGAAGTSLLSLSFVSAYFPEHFAYTRKKSASARNVTGTVVGAMLLGAGMHLCGACPGMVPAAVANKVPNSEYTLAGGLAGAMVYGFLHPLLGDVFDREQMPFELEKLLGTTHAKVASVLGLTLLGSALALERVIPWKTELGTPNPPDSTYFTAPTWHPIAAGVMIGLLQVPGALVLGNTVGAASSYACATGQWLRLFSDDSRAKFQHFRSQLSRWWQVLYVSSGAIGATVALRTAAGGERAPPEGFSPKRSFVGGFILLVGARMAKGCTSGHGLSGMGLLASSAFLAVASMFAGGAIASRFTHNFK